MDFLPLFGPKNLQRISKGPKMTRAALSFAAAICGCAVMVAVMVAVVSAAPAPRVKVRNAATVCAPACIGGL